MVRALYVSAVDSPEEGGMTPEELSTLLKTVMSSDRCVGMEVAVTA